MIRLFVFLITFILLTCYLLAADSLKVINVLPAQQSISASPNTTIEIEFNIRVNALTFNNTTFMVWGRWSGVHKGTVDLTFCLRV